MEQPYQIDEYPIKCGDCNDLVDCYVDDFLELVRKGLTKAEALDNMGILDHVLELDSLIRAKSH